MRDNKLSPLGAALSAAQKNSRGWLYLFFLLLLATLVLSVFVPNHHPHFVYDAYFGFWPLFGLIVGVLMVLFVKKIVQPLLKRPEDFYGDL